MSRLAASAALLRGDELDSLAACQDHGIATTAQTRMVREAVGGRPAISRTKKGDAPRLEGRPPRRSQFATAAPVRDGPGIQSKKDRSQLEWRPPAPAQTQIRHLLGGIRAAPGTPGRRLRNLQADIRPDALRRSLPQDRARARSLVSQMQCRTRLLRRRSELPANGCSLSGTLRAAIHRHSRAGSWDGLSAIGR